MERRLRLGAALGLGFWGKGRGKSRVKKMRTCEWMAIPLPRILLKSFSPSTTCAQGGEAPGDLGARERWLGKCGSEDKESGE